MTTSYTSPKGNIITVHRPELTEEERTKRMTAIKAAAVRLIITTEKAKAHKNRKGAKT